MATYSAWGICYLGRRVLLVVHFVGGAQPPCYDYESSQYLRIVPSEEVTRGIVTYYLCKLLEKKTDRQQESAKEVGIGESR